MEPKSMYAVIVRGGEYSDSWTDTLAVSASEDRCAEYIKECKADDAYYDDIVKKLDEYQDKYRETNPSPPWDSSQTLPRPRWKSGLKESEITPEMRAERKAVDEHNQRLNDEHTALQNAWSKLYENAQREFLTQIGVPENRHDEFIGYRGYIVRTEDRRYSIEKVKFLD